jgi:hypothetical protein
MVLEILAHWRKPMIELAYLDKRNIVFSQREVDIMARNMLPRDRAYIVSSSGRVLRQESQQEAAKRRFRIIKVELA